MKFNPAIGKNTPDPFENPKTQSSKIVGIVEKINDDGTVTIHTTVEQLSELFEERPDLLLKYLKKQKE